MDAESSAVWDGEKIGALFAGSREAMRALHGDACCVQSNQSKYCEVLGTKKCRSSWNEMTQYGTPVRSKGRKQPYFEEDQCSFT